MLIHQIPPRPNYLRVKTGRQLAKIGAVALKNSVYVLPWSNDALEDFQWIARELTSGGAEATVVEANLLDGPSDSAVESLFHGARNADYQALEDEAKRLAERIPSGPDPGLLRTLATEVVRLERKFGEVADLDFFGAPGRERTARLLGNLRQRTLGPREASAASAVSARNDYRGRTWVTRSDIHVDRMASAWLIRRLVDPEARFKFVPTKGYEPEPADVRFDMFEAEFTHVGDLCTFEVLCERMKLDSPGLRPIAEMVHDLDLKEAKFGRPETPGLAAQLAGIALVHREDAARVERGCEVFDELRAFFAQKRRKSGAA